MCVSELENLTALFRYRQPLLFSDLAGGEIFRRPRVDMVGDSRARGFDSPQALGARHEGALRFTAFFGGFTVN